MKGSAYAPLGICVVAGYRLSWGVVLQRIRAYVIYFLPFIVKAICFYFYCFTVSTQTRMTIYWQVTCSYNLQKHTSFTFNEEHHIYLYMISHIRTLSLISKYYFTALLIPVYQRCKEVGKKKLKVHSQTFGHLLKKACNVVFAETVRPCYSSQIDSSDSMASLFTLQSKWQKTTYRTIHNTQTQ